MTSNKLQKTVTVVALSRGSLLNTATIANKLKLGHKRSEEMLNIAPNKIK